MPGGFYNETVNIDRLSIDFDNSNWHKIVYSVDGKIGSTTHGRDRLNHGFYPVYLVVMSSFLNDHSKL